MRDWDNIIAIYLSLPFLLHWLLSFTWSKRDNGNSLAVCDIWVFLKYKVVLNCWCGTVCKAQRTFKPVSLFIFFFPFSLHSQDLRMGSIIPQQDTAATVSPQCHPDLFHFNTVEGWHGHLLRRKPEDHRNPCLIKYGCIFHRRISREGFWIPQEDTTWRH